MSTLSCCRRPGKALIESLRVRPTSEARPMSARSLPRTSRWVGQDSCRCNAPPGRVLGSRGVRIVPFVRSSFSHGVISRLKPILAPVRRSSRERRGVSLTRSSPIYCPPRVLCRGYLSRLPIDECRSQLKRRAGNRVAPFSPQFSTKTNKQSCVLSMNRRVLG
jgi:hypothetical protein